MGVEHLLKFLKEKISENININQLHSNIGIDGQIWLWKLERML